MRFSGSIVERLLLPRAVRRGVEGPLRIEPAVFDRFLRAPFDVVTSFTPPPGREGKPSSGRGKDHPRYGRFVYALARELRPDLVVEVGTSAGGTAVGWARALVENGGGALVCLDNDSYASGTYPEVARRNIASTGLAQERYELLSGDSRELLLDLALRHERQVDIVLVDGDHTYDGATLDIASGLRMLRPGGLLLVHDVDRGRRMDEATAEHPYPVHEAFMAAVRGAGLEWCVLRFVRKHLGVARAE
ncbi:MAG: class I SAM-dependent methyltransferase [bacterium]|nr:class I SAM-dependent methyltransferase [bacterium]